MQDRNSELALDPLLCGEEDPEDISSPRASHKSIRGED